MVARQVDDLSPALHHVREVHDLLLDLRVGRIVAAPISVWLDRCVIEPPEVTGFTSEFYVFLSSLSIYGFDISLYIRKLSKIFSLPSFVDLIDELFSQI